MHGFSNKTDQWPQYGQRSEPRIAVSQRSEAFGLGGIKQSTPWALGAGSSLLALCYWPIATAFGP